MPLRRPYIFPIMLTTLFLAGRPGSQAFPQAQVQDAQTSKDDGFALAVQTVIKSADDEFRSIRGNPDLRSVGREWRTEFRLPGMEACRIFERNRVLAFECETPFPASKELAMDGYENFVSRIARSIGREWEYEVDQQSITSGFTKSVTFRRIENGRSENLPAQSKDQPPEIAPAASMGPTPFGLYIQNAKVSGSDRSGEATNPEVGVLVTSICSDSFAAGIGLQPGDVITSINRHSIRSTEDILAIERGIKPEDALAFKITRSGSGRPTTMFVPGVFPGGFRPNSSLASTNCANVLPSPPAVDQASPPDDLFTRFFDQQRRDSQVRYPRRREITMVARVFAQAGHREQGDPSAPHYVFSFAVRRIDWPSIGARLQQPRATVGLIFLRDSDPTLLPSFGAAHGLILAAPEADGPAAKAGLQEGDVVLAVNGTPVWDGDALVSKLALIAVGQSVSITYLRDGKEHEAKSLAIANPQSDSGSSIASGSAIDRIRSGQHSQMPREERVGVGAIGTSQGIALANNTAYTIQVHFRGPITRSVKISPGGSLNVDLPPGRYEEAAEALNSDIIPYYGEHFQDVGAGYKVSFYIAPR